jgi:hypothetical protein
MAISMLPTQYVGPTPVNPDDMVNRKQAQTILNSAPVNRAGVSSQIHTTATTTYAPKTYIDTQDAQYALPSYYQTQDQYNIPLTVMDSLNLDFNGVPTPLTMPQGSVVPPAYGVATLDASGLVPLSEIPSIGAGYLLGPYGPSTSVTGQVAGATYEAALDFMDFKIGVPYFPFQPLVFVSAIVQSAPGGRPVIEARMSNGQAHYVNQDLIARGVGRSNFIDPQALGMIPSPNNPGAPAGAYPSTYNIFISLYIYDMYQSATITTTGIASAGVYLLRLGE